MNRRLFFTKLLTGLAAIPLVERLCGKDNPESLAVLSRQLSKWSTEVARIYRTPGLYETQERRIKNLESIVTCRGGIVQTRPGTVLFEIPKEAGRVLGLSVWGDRRLIILCEYGPWVSYPPYKSCEKFQHAQI